MHETLRFNITIEESLAQQGKIKEATNLLEQSLNRHPQNRDLQELLALVRQQYRIESVKLSNWSCGLPEPVTSNSRESV